MLYQVGPKAVKHDVSYSWNNCLSPIGCLFFFIVYQWKCRRIGFLELVDFGPGLWTRKHWTFDSISVQKWQNTQPKLHKSKVQFSHGARVHCTESKAQFFRVQSPGPKSSDSSKPVKSPCTTKYQTLCSSPVFSALAGSHNWVIAFKMEESGDLENISSNISAWFWFWEALMWDFEHKEFVCWTHSFCCNTYEHNVWYLVVQGEIVGIVISRTFSVIKYDCLHRIWCIQRIHGKLHAKQDKC